MTFQRPYHALSVLACVLAAAGAALAVAGCSKVTPLSGDPPRASFPPAGHLGSPIIVQVVRSQLPTASGRCPAGSVDIYGKALVPRAVTRAHQLIHPGSTVKHTVTPAAAPAVSPAGPSPGGLACYSPAGKPVTITSAAVSAVATYPPPSGTPKAPAIYGFAVAFPAADVPAVTAVIKQAYDSRGSFGITVAGKLWQAFPVHRLLTGRAAQISLLSKRQAVQLHRLLVPSG